MFRPDDALTRKQKISVFLIIFTWLILLFLAPASPVYAIPTPVPTVWSNSLFSMTVSPESVKAGDTFELKILLDTDTPSRGAEVGLTFDPKLVEIIELVEGSYYKDFAATSGASTLMMPPAPVIDNAKGTVAGSGITVMGGSPTGAQGQKGNGIFLVYKIKAKANGSAKFGLLGIKLWDAKAIGAPQTMEGVKAQDFTVMIGGGSAVQSTARVASAPGAANSTAGATAVRRVTATPASFSAGGDASGFPWWILIPISLTGILGAALVFFTRKR